MVDFMWNILNYRVLVPESYFRVTLATTQFRIVCSRVLCKNANTEMGVTIILPVVLYVPKT
jgi:hypothetical protein